SVQEPSHVGNYWHVPRNRGVVSFPRLGVVNDDKPAFKIHVRPSHLARFGNSATGKGEKSNEVRTTVRLTGAARVDRLKNLLELVRFGKMQLCWLHAKSLHFLGRVIDSNDAGAFQNCPERAKRVVEILRVQFLGKPAGPLLAIRFADAVQLELVEFGP